MLGEAEGEMRPLGTSALMVVEPKSEERDETKGALVSSRSAHEGAGL